MDNATDMWNTWVRLRPKNRFPSGLLYVFNDWTQENIEIMPKSYSWDGVYSEIASFSEGKGEMAS
jgi:hypothetical protein